MNNWAIIIGVDKYVYQDKLKNAVADARFVATTLHDDYGFQRSRIATLYDSHATRSRILRLINVVIPTRWRVQANDQLLVFFAGHGGRAKHEGRRKPWFLAPVDGKRVSENRANWRTVLTAVDIRNLETSFKGAHIFYVFDCCYSGMAFSYQAPANRNTTIQSIHALVAGQGHETVNDECGSGHSVFTQSFVEALSGWGPLGVSQDGSFIASDLISFVRRDVPHQIKKKRLKPLQRPFGGPLVGNTGGTEFTFRPIAPRLPAHIVSLLEHDHVETRRSAVRQIAELDGAKLNAVKRLAIYRMAGDEASTVRVEVARRAIAILGRDALELLVELLNQPDEHVTLEVLNVLPDLRRHRAQIIPKVRKLLTATSSRLRRATQMCLALLGVETALGAVIEQLPTEQGSIRREIIYELRKIPSHLVSKETMTQRIAAHLRDKEWRNRRAAAEALGELGLSAAGDSLMRLASSRTQHFMVRYSAVEALGHLGEAGARQLVLDVLVSDRSLLVRTAAAEAAGSLGGRNAIDVLIRVMKSDPEWRVRRSAVESCGLLGSRDATDGLITVSTDPHYRVRMAVAQAMGEIGDPKSREALKPLVDKDQSLFVKRAASRTLDRLNAK
jgi:HEAT repeat protein